MGHTSRTLHTPRSPQRQHDDHDAHDMSSIKLTASEVHVGEVLEADEGHHISPSVAALLSDHYTGPSLLVRAWGVWSLSTLLGPLCLGFWGHFLAPGNKKHSSTPFSFTTHLTPNSCFRIPIEWPRWFWGNSSGILELGSAARDCCE